MCMALEESPNQRGRKGVEVDAVAIEGRNAKRPLDPLGIEMRCEVCPLGLPPLAGMEAHRAP